MVSQNTRHHMSLHDNVTWIPEKMPSKDMKSKIKLKTALRNRSWDTPTHCQVSHCACQCRTCFWTLQRDEDGSIVGKCRCPSRAPAVCSLLHKRQLSCQQRRVQQPNAKDPSEASRASIEAAKQPSVNSAFFDEKKKMFRSYLVGQIEMIEIVSCFWDF